MESFYVVPAHGGGMLLFEEQMSLGNAPLGLSLLFLTAMLYSVVIGSVCTHHIPHVLAPCISSM